MFDILNAQFNSRSEMLDPHLFQIPRTLLMEINSIFQNEYILIIEKLFQLKSGKWFQQSVNILFEWLKNPETLRS